MPCSEIILKTVGIFSTCVLGFFLFLYIIIKLDRWLELNRRRRELKEEFYNLLLEKLTEDKK